MQFDYDLSAARELRLSVSGYILDKKGFRFFSTRRLRVLVGDVATSDKTQYFNEINIKNEQFNIWNHQA
jgi:hypothetical protein